MEKVEEKMGKDLLTNAMNYKLEDVLPGTYMSEYRQFRAVAQLYAFGLNAFIDRKHVSTYLYVHSTVCMNNVC